MRVIRAKQMTLRPVFSVFLVLHCPLGLADIHHACAFPDVVFPSLHLSVPSSPPPLSLVLARRDKWEIWPYQFSLPLSVIARSLSGPINCLLDLGVDFLIGNVVFVCDGSYLVLEYHFRDLHI